MDVSDKLGHWTEVPVAYNQRDAIIYALGVGCSDLRFVYEKAKGFAVFPTYPFALTFKGAATDVQAFPPPSLTAARPILLPGTRVGLDAERFLEVVTPLPPSPPPLRLRSRVVGVHAKGKGALVESESELVSDAGVVYCKLRAGAFMVGAKGFKDCGVSFSNAVVVPPRAPDVTSAIAVGANHTHLYRLSGDYNPLHVDPGFARRSGFSDPILHGLCTLGMTVRAVLEAWCDGDPAVFKAVKARFASPVMPGDTLVVQMWGTTNNGTTAATKDEVQRHGGRVIVQTVVQASGKVVLNNSFVDLLPRADVARL